MIIYSIASVICPCFILILSSYIWLGAESNNWNNPNNWKDQTVPNVNSDVLIDYTLYNGGYNPVINNSVELNSLVIQNSAVLEVYDTLTVTGNITIENSSSLRLKSGLINVKGNWINNGGNFISENNTLKFSGNSYQTIAGSYSPQFFYNIIIDKSGGILNFGENVKNITLNNLFISSSNNADIIAPDTLNITYSSGSSLQIDSGNVGIIYGGKLLQIRGNWTNNANESVFNPGTGTIRFIQGAVQQINGKTAAHRFYNIEIAKNNQSVTLAGNAKELIVNNFTQTSYLFNASALNKFYVTGNFLHTSGTFVPCNNIYISGNITDNHLYGGLTWGDSVTLNGAAAQYINGSYSTTFKSLVINNTDKTGVVIQKTTSVSNVLRFNQGYVHTNISNLIILKNGAKSNIGSDNSFVDGPITKIGNTSFIFPVGNEGRWAPLEIVNDAGFKNFNTTTQFTCTYYKQTAPYNNNPEYLETGITYGSFNEFWDLERNDPGNDAQCNVRLHFKSAERSGLKIESIDDFKVIHLSSVHGFYQNQGGIPFYSEGGAGYITSVFPLKDFSPITFGYMGSANPLPIDLLNFDAIVLPNNKIELKWEVANEINNDFYTVERSMDGINFKPIISKKGLGTINQKHSYSVIDDDPYSGSNYYRLKQTDVDGKHNVYKTIHAYLDHDIEESLICQNPLLSNEELIIKINSGSDKLMRLTIIDSYGRTVSIKPIALNAGQNIVNAEDLGCALNPGIYYIVVSDDIAAYTEKLVVQ